MGRRKYTMTKQATVRLISNMVAVIFPESVPQPLSKSREQE